ncbi:MAG TPA: hypothetical protein DCX22_04825 [Dehalococcoidia bacterium]|nr:hypothetical protein [Dehalococcoidia bacterium]
MNITEIFQPINSDLLRVEECLRSSANVDIPLVAELLNYVTQSGGKRLRPALTLFCGKTCNYDLDALIPMAAATEILHTATLVHDDIIDHAELRRGKPAVYRKCGESTALLLGDYMFAKAGHLAAATGSLRVVSIFARTLMTISGGELGQIGIDYNLDQALDRYYRWIDAKTASLFTMATECGSVLSGCSEDIILVLQDYGHNLGMAFQVVDDILDFVGDKATLGKPVGSDLSEGTVTLPSIMYVLAHRDDALIKSIVKDKKRDRSTVQKAVKKIKDSGVIEDCFKIANDYCSRACRDLDKIRNPSVRDSLHNLAEYVTRRNK